MKPFKHVSALFLMLFCFITGSVTAQRNMLVTAANKAAVAQYLLPKQKWVSYPSYNNRDGWDALIGKSKEEIIKKGEAFLAYEWKVVTATNYLAYERTGARTVMEIPFNKNNEALMHLFLAEMTEGKGRFLDQIINGVWHTCDMRTWVLSAHQPVQKTKRSLPNESEVIIDLTSGDIGSMLSWIHHFLAPEFDKVDPVIASRIRKEVKNRILDPYLERSDYWWQALTGGPDRMVNNWNPWCNFNVLTAFLLMEEDKQRLTDAVYKTMSSVDKFIDYTKDDGACEEGPSYWGHAAGKMYDYLQILAYATGGKIDIFSSTKIKSMGEYISRSYIGDGWVVNFADASAQGGGEASFVYRYGKAVNSAELKGFGAYLSTRGPEKVIHDRDAFRTLEYLWSKNELAATKPALSNAAYTWYPQTEFCYMRSDSVFFAAKGGYNAESHNHNDVGSFVYYVKNKPLLIDAGVGTYTKFTFGPQRYSIWTMQSNFHNLPMPNGFSQKDGKEFRSKNVVFDSLAKSLKLDIAGAYEKEAGVDQWTLQYQLSKTGTLTISENFVLQQAQQANQLNFLCATKPVVVEPGKIKFTNESSSALFMYDAKTFDVQFEPVTLDDTRLSKVWGNTIYRMIFKDKRITNKGKYQFNIFPEN